MSPAAHGGLNAQFGGPAGLLQRQIESVRQMLNFNESPSSGGQGLGGSEPQWKVLVYDQVIIIKCFSGNHFYPMKILYTISDIKSNFHYLHVGTFAVFCVFD